MPEWFQKQTVGDLPASAAARFGERSALWFGEQHWTYRQLSDAVDAVAKSLMALGIERGDKISLWANNRPEWIFLMFAAAKVGAVLVPINTRFRTEDFSYTVRQSDSRLLLAVDRSGPIDYRSMIEDVITPAHRAGPTSIRCPDLPMLDHVVMITDAHCPGFFNWPDFLAAGAAISDAALAARAASIDPDDLLIIAYTSGTTGHPKGVMHGHCAIRNVVDTASRIGLTFEDVMVNYLPLFHLYSYSGCCLMSVASGACQVLMDNFDAAEALDLVEKRRISVIHGFDAHYRDLLQEQGRRPRDISSLRFATFPAGMDSSAATARRVQGEFCPSVSVYGMTELWTFPAISFANSTSEQRCEASGFPSPGYDFRFVDRESGADLPDGQLGEILVRGYMVTRGYYKDPEATAAAIDADGWLHTGDLGFRRPDGHIKFIGRGKDMLKVGGENVAPAEVEAFLTRHPDILEAAVVGVPDERLSEVGCAFLVLRPGATINPLELAAYCKGRIASFKIPRYFHARDSLPMTPSGKVKKVELKQLALGLMQQESAARARS